MPDSSLIGPLIGLAVLVYLLVKFAPVPLQWLRQRGSNSWPWVESSVDGGTVEVVSSGRGERTYALTAHYTYTVAGLKYTGIYREWFGDESGAQSMLQSLRELPPPARYRPSDPSHSVIDPYRDAALALDSHRAS